MKKLLLLLVLTSLSITTFAQPVKDSAAIGARLLRISEFQEDAGNLFFATGAGLFVVTGALLRNNDIDARTTAYMVAIGGGFVGTGLMLGRISRQNAENALRFAVTDQVVYLPAHGAPAMRRQGALTLRIPL